MNISAILRNMIKFIVLWNSIEFVIILNIIKFVFIKTSAQRRGVLSSAKIHVSNKKTLNPKDVCLSNMHGSC